MATVLLRPKYSNMHETDAVGGTELTQLMFRFEEIAIAHRHRMAHNRDLSTTQMGLWEQVLSIHQTNKQIGGSTPARRAKFGGGADMKNNGMATTLCISAMELRLTYQASCILSNSNLFKLIFQPNPSNKPCHKYIDLCSPTAGVR